MQLIEILDSYIAKGSISEKELMFLEYNSNLIEEELFLKINGKAVPKINELIKFGINCCFDNDLEIAKKIALACLKYNNQSYSTSLFDFYVSLIEGDLDLITKKLESLGENSINERQIHNYHYFSIILDYLIDTPVSDLQKKHIFKNDIFLTESKGALELHLQNVIRRKIYNNQFFIAKKHFDSAPINRQVLLEDIVHKKLIDMAYDKNMEFRNKVRSCLEREAYNEAIDLLEHEAGAEHLCFEEKYALKVCLQIRNIIETNLIPIPIPMNDEKADNFENVMYPYINHQDYQKAFDKYIELIGIQESSPLYNALKSILLLIEKKSRFDFANIIDIIYKGNYDALLITLKKYGIEDYYELIKDYMRLAKYENDFNFTDATSVLYQLLYTDFSFDFDYYKELFSKAIEKEDEHYSRLYLKMIAHADVNNEHSGFVTKAGELYQNTFNKEFIVTGNFGLHVINKFCDLREEKYVLCSLNNCTEDRKKQAELLLAKNKDMKGFYFEDKNILTLIYSPYVKGFNPLPVVQRANELYKTGNFKSALDYYRKLVMYGKPMPYIFGNYGICLYHVGEYKEAFDTLEYAYNIYPDRNAAEFFKRYMELCRLKGDDYKLLYYKQTDVDNMFETYPFIKKMQELLAQGMSLDEAISFLKLTEDEITIVYIICAQDSYILNEFDEGDFYIDLIDPKSIKDKTVRDWYYEAIDNRIFLSRRYQDDSKKVLFKNKYL